MPKKIKIPAHLIREYKKVYEYPLNWCPLWGYVPDFEETNLPKEKDISEIWNDCVSIIEIVRYFDFDIELPNMQKYIALPNLDKIKLPVVFGDELDDILKTRYRERRSEHEAIRRVFQNLDYIKLKTSYSPHIMNLIKKVSVDENGTPQQQIGRANNKKQDALSIAAGQIHINDEGIGDYDELLKEAQKIAGDSVVLNYQKYFSLSAILEAWLVLTSLLYNPRQCLRIAALYEIQKKIKYAYYLMYEAEGYEQREEKNKLKRAAQIGQTQIDTGHEHGWPRYWQRKDIKEARDAKLEKLKDIIKNQTDENKEENILWTDMAKLIYEQTAEERKNGKNGFSFDNIRKKKELKKFFEQLKSQKKPTP